MGRLVVISNRIAPPDDKKASAGGLAVGILGALKAAGGLWFGWSGEIGDDQKPLNTVTRGNITWASFTLNERDHDEYYNQFSNAVLWPAFHYRLDLVDFQRPSWDGYLRVNANLAKKLLPLIEPDDILWIHDYHLLPFASELRKLGVNNRIGFFCTFRSRRLRFLTRCLRMPSFLSSSVTTICLASRPITTGWRFLIASRYRPGW
ncbi:Alpha,alpha-trehalose-phosphate synthase [UDP-forming] [Raoultella planticola]|uniref:Alpha,alpha-trehalose-phosphate synthase [UDP-forming] n=1 Tax=Raoultella planticola TaxID=575 RepID=A0A485AD31_RAOPL|nr:Alpha,alpha-trehalose-phosphate synthase [UDP-forming] [Raoultella planticola]